MLVAFGMAQNERIRTFLAIEVQDALKEEARTVLESIRLKNPHFRFIPPENWHLTFHFFGSISPEKLEEVDKGLKDVVRKTAPFSIWLKGFGVFPSERAPRVLWVGVEGAGDSLVRLKHEIDAAILKIDLPVEERKFHPHLTIARAREERNQKEVVFDPLSFAGKLNQTVDRLTLFRSELLPGGAKYTVLDTIPLKSK